MRELFQVYVWSLILLAALVYTVGNSYLQRKDFETNDNERPGRPQLSLLQPIAYFRFNVTYWLDIGLEGVDGEIADIVCLSLNSAAAHQHYCLGKLLENRYLVNSALIVKSTSFHENLLDILSFSNDKHIS